MSLKLVLISPTGTLIDEDRNLSPQLVKQLCGVIERLGAAGVRFAIWSNKRWTLKAGTTTLQDYVSERAKCAVEYVGAAAGSKYPARRRGGSVDPILKQFGAARNETLLVGNGQEDLMAGVNNQLLLVRPQWYATESEYGFPVQSVAELERFCTIFGLREHPIFWSIDNDGLRVRAMGPYSTRIKEYADLGVDALQAAKYEKGSLEFWHRLAVSSLYFSGLIAQVDYIASYPGHEKGTKVRAVNDVMSLLGKCFRKTFYPDLIERHTTAVKSAYATDAEKTFKNQLNTIRLNAHPHKYGGDTPLRSPINLKNKTVLVVDDICTRGRSIDCARAYIEAAGGSAVSFAWLKTINSSYLRMNPAPSLKPFSTNSIANEPESQAYGYGDGIQDAEAPAEIASLLDKYKAWKI
jgi:predicted amidophosphoribosyltransferase